MKKNSTEIKWGVIFFISMLIWIGIERAAGLHSTHIDKHAVYTNIFAIVAIALYVFALREKREKDYSGTMSWKQGFISGLIISVVVTVLSPLGQWITHTIITPDYFSNVIEYSVSSGKMTREAAEQYFSLGGYVVQSMIGALVMGVVTSAVVALFVKKK